MIDSTVSVAHPMPPPPMEKPKMKDVTILKQLSVNRSDGTYLFTIEVANTTGVRCARVMAPDGSRRLLGCASAISAAMKQVQDLERLSSSYFAYDRISGGAA
jgi:hypothetical protein